VEHGAGAAFAVLPGAFRGAELDVLLGAGERVAVATFTLVREAIAHCVTAGASASDDPHTDTWLLWAALHGVATLEKPARSDYLRLRPLDRPAMLETLIRRIARLS
jgi:AcrR family transcriptional regulator